MSEQPFDLVENLEQQIQALAEALMDLNYGNLNSSGVVQGMASRQKGCHNYGKTPEQCRQELIEKHKLYKSADGHSIYESNIEYDPRFYDYDSVFFRNWNL